jgi:hypothetical protein
MLIIIFLIVGLGGIPKDRVPESSIISVRKDKIKEREKNIIKSLTH